MLLIDDEADITYALKLGLERTGIDVTVFNDPLEALQELKKEHDYDLIICDIRMPGMSGSELYRQMRRHDADTPIAFMSASEVYPREFETIIPDLGPRALLKKPMTIADLAARVHEMLDGTDEVTPNQSAPN